MTQVVLASTLYGAATVVAAIEAGELDASTKRVLVMANTTAVPELAPTVADMPGFTAIAGQFDRIVSYNEAIAPYHPSIWAPMPEDAIVLERHLRQLWELGEGAIELVLESIQVPPALSLATIFASSRITIYADGLMSYSPTRTRIGSQVGARVREVIHPDLVPGLQPALLREFATPARPLDVAPLRGVLDDMTESIDLSALPATSAQQEHVLVVGQYLAALGVLTERKEQELHQRMVSAAVGAGASAVWFKAHPSAPASVNDALAAWAREQHVDLSILPAAVPAETVFAVAPPRYVVGCFSTALMTAVRLYGIPAATVGTDLLLGALKPYENSNRIPVTIVASVLPDLERTREAPRTPNLAPSLVEEQLQPLVDAVAYCMQPVTLNALHGRARAWLESHPGPPTERFFDRARLTALGLPGGAYVPGWRRLDPANRIRIRRAVGQSRNAARQMTAAMKKTVKP